MFVALLSNRERNRTGERTDGLGGFCKMMFEGLSDHQYLHTSTTQTYQRVCIALVNDPTEHHEDIVLRLQPCRVLLGPDKYEMLLQGSS